MTSTLPRPAAEPAPAEPERTGYGFRIVVGVIVVVVAVLVCYPLIRLLSGLFVVGEQFVGLTSIRETLAIPELTSALVGSLVLIMVAGGLAVVIGCLLAWLNERTDARMGLVSDLLQVVPMMMPPLATAIGYVVLFAPGAGYVNLVLRALGGGAATSGPLDVYGTVGLVAVTTVIAVPLAYLPVSAALRALDPQLEEASRISGESAFGTLRKVTLPAVRNAIATAAVLVVITILALFSVPIIIGSQGNIDTLPTLVFRVLHNASGPRYDQAVVLSVFMLVVVQAALLVEFAVKRSGHYARIAGKGRSGSRYRLGRWRGPARLLVIGYLMAAIVLPFLALVFVSLQPFWSQNIDLASFSADNYLGLLSSGSTLGRAFTNSLLLGISSATVLVLVAALIAYFVATSSGLVARVVTAIVALPASVPHVVIGVAFLIAVASQRFGSVSLNGTLTVLFLAYLVISLPSATRVADAALAQVGRELWEGSLMSGAGHLRTFLRILLPLMLPGLVAGWAIVFTHSFSEISASVFLAQPLANPVSGSAIVDLFRGTGTISELAALAVVVTAVQSVVVFVVLVLGGRRYSYLS